MDDPRRTTLPNEALLRRELGRWDLTAIGVNQVIGSAIFLMPSQVYRLAGPWSPLAFVLVGAASLLVALSFAEAASRFDRTGGPYLFTRAAFGRFLAFEVGWMLWFTRATSQAAVASGVALALGYYWPAAQSGWGRGAVLTGLIGAIALVNVRGIRESAWTVNLFTVGKLLPLAIFILVGLPQVHLAELRPAGPIAPGDAAAAALLLIFTYGGYEVIPVPAGEARDPRGHVPFALVMTIVIVTIVYVACQIVAQATVDDLAAAETPLADGAAVLLGPAGALLISVGSIVSMTGNNVGQVLSGSRNLFALAAQGDLPAWFGRVHLGYRTPANAVLFTSAVALGLALTGSFVKLAAASAVARLVVYTATCASTLALRRPDIERRVGPARFVVPGGPLVPLAAMAVSLTILAGATREQLTTGAAALAAGALLFAAAARGSRRVGS